MKKLITFILLLCSIVMYSQNYLGHSVADTKSVIKANPEYTILTQEWLTGDNDGIYCVQTKDTQGYLFTMHYINDICYHYSIYGDLKDINAYIIFLRNNCIAGKEYWYDYSGTYPCKFKLTRQAYEGTFIIDGYLIIDE